MTKGQREFELCKGVADSPDCGRKYWIAWERGALGATAPADPILSPAPFCDGIERRKSRGVGDLIERGITAATAGLVRSCGACKDRQALLNHWFPADVPQIEPTDLSSATRHLTFFVWPVKNFGAWQWNLDKLLERAELFNGRRIVSIAVDGQTDTPDAVREYLKGFTDDFIVVKNDRRLREVVSWVPMLEMLESYQSESDVTFSAHAKCVRHNLSPDVEGSTIFHWAAAMWETTCDWATVRPLLERHATVGSFRRFNEKPSRHSWGPWHYSGTFYWWRNRDAYRRNWRYVPNRFYGTEAWPGILFRREEAACIIGDDVGDLYTMQAWLKAEAELIEWRNKKSLYNT